MNSSKTRAFATNILISLISITITIAIVEVFLRIYYTGSLSLRPKNEITHYSKSDSTLGWTLNPNADGIFFRPSRGVRGYVTIDDNGIRSNGHPVVPRENSLLIIGDSTTAGFEVDNDKTFSAVLERRLNENGCDYNVYNAGVRGYGTDQSYWRMQRLIKKLKPDHVLYMFTKNDFDNNRTIKIAYSTLVKPVYIFHDDKLSIRDLPAQPYAREHFARVQYSQDGYTIIEGDAPTESKKTEDIKKSIKNHFAIYYLAKTAYHQFRALTNSLKAVPSTTTIQGTSPPPVSESQNIDDQILKLILAKASDEAGSFMLSSFTDGATWERERLATIAAELGIQYLDITPFFTEPVENYRWKNDFHWTEKGHAQAAEALNELLTPILCN